MGWTLARTGLAGEPRGAAAERGGPHADRRRRRWAKPLLLVLASNFPDADLVLGVLGSESYLMWHRGLTHSLLGLAIFPPALAFLGHALAPRLSFARALLLCEIAVLSHVLLDVPTSWGTLFLYPWSHQRFALDWVFIVDPVLWLVPLAGILLGIRRSELFRRRSARGALAISAAYVLLAGGAHAAAETEAVRALRGTAPHNSPRAASRERELFGVEVYPRPLSPARWHGVAWTPDSLLHLSIGGFPPRTRLAAREPHRLRDPLAREALFTPAGQSFLWWSGAPAARVLERTAERSVVGLSDRRFRIPGGGRDVFGLEIALDGEGRYLGATWEGDSIFRPEGRGPAAGLAAEEEPSRAQP